MMNLFVDDPCSVSPESLDVARLLTGQLARQEVIAHGVIPWSSPVVSFGDVQKAQVGTLGLNPSNREFVDSEGIELMGKQRRLHTLRSLRLANWAHVNDEDLKVITAACFRYFELNPYEAWFRPLEYILSGAGASYYGTSRPACHLDLIPFATSRKWTGIPRLSRAALLAAGAVALVALLKASRIGTLVLNGQSVVVNFTQLANVSLTRREMREWLLPRSSGRGIIGVAYHGSIDAIGGVSLGRTVLILGYNHNLQSSYGVTARVKSAIRDWVEERVDGAPT